MVGWAYIGNKILGLILGLSEQSIISIEKKLIGYNLLEVKGHLKRTTQKWYDNIILDNDNLYENQSYNELKCFYCDKSIKETPLEVDHYISRKNKGLNDESNLVLCCTDCNQIKKEMNGDEYLKLLKKEVKYPKTKETLTFYKTKETLIKNQRNFNSNTKETLYNIYNDNNNININNNKRKKPEEVKEILRYFKKVYGIKSLPNQLVQLGAAQWLFNEKGLEKTKHAILAAYHCRGTEYAPSINNLMDLRDKYIQLEGYYMKLKKKGENGKGLAII